MARERGNVRGRAWWLAWGILVVAVLIAALDVVLAVLDVSHHPPSADLIRDQPQVQDNGRGFDPAARQKGSGTQNMEDRLDALGGCAVVTSEVGAGTRVTGTLPIGVVVAV
ncbi:MAG: hypothetical protein WAT58_01565 [Candidatus Dormiibacterota bacterium]